jgi:hypothetical protein
VIQNDRSNYRFTFYLSLLKSNIEFRTEEVEDWELDKKIEDKHQQ